MSNGIFVAHGRLMVDCAVEFVAGSGGVEEAALLAHPVIKQLLSVLCSCAEVSPLRPSPPKLSPPHPASVCEVLTPEGRKYVSRRHFHDLSAAILAALGNPPSGEASKAADRALENTDWECLLRIPLDSPDETPGKAEEGAEPGGQAASTVIEVALEAGQAPSEVADPRQLESLLFKLVDLWCSTFDPKEYIDFLVGLLDAICLVSETEGIQIRVPELTLTLTLTLI